MATLYMHYPRSVCYGWTRNCIGSSGIARRTDLDAWGRAGAGHGSIRLGPLRRYMG